MAFLSVSHCSQKDQTLKWASSFQCTLASHLQVDMAPHSSLSVSNATVYQPLQQRKLLNWNSPPPIGPVNHFPNPALRLVHRVVTSGLTLQINSECMLERCQLRRLTAVGGKADVFRLSNQAQRTAPFLELCHDYSRLFRQSQLAALGRSCGGLAVWNTKSSFLSSSELQLGLQAGNSF